MLIDNRFGALDSIKMSSKLRSQGTYHEGLILDIINALKGLMQQSNVQNAFSNPDFSIIIAAVGHMRSFVIEIEPYEDWFSTVGCLRVVN